MRIATILMLGVCRSANTMPHATRPKRQFDRIDKVWYTLTLSVNKKRRKHKMEGRIVTQVAVASTDTRIDGQHSRVTYYQESDTAAYYVTDAERAELCQLAQEQTISLADDEMIDLIDGIGERGVVFM